MSEGPFPGVLCCVPVPAHAWLWLCAVMCMCLCAPGRAGGGELNLTCPSIWLPWGGEPHLRGWWVAALPTSPVSEVPGLKGKTSLG